MKYKLFLAFSLLFLLSSCDSRDSKYLRGKTVSDKDGCVFIVRLSGIGNNGQSTYYLDFVKDASKDTCLFDIKEDK